MICGDLFWLEIFLLVFVFWNARCNKSRLLIHSVTQLLDIKLKPRRSLVQYCKNAMEKLYNKINLCKTYYDVSVCYFLIMVDSHFFHFFSVTFYVLFYVVLWSLKSLFMSFTVYSHLLHLNHLFHIFSRKKLNGIQIENCSALC